VQIGDVAPDFTLVDQGGHELTLSALLTHGPVALFFYPAAMSAGCTKETCHFRDLASEFVALGAQRIGISMDGVQRQAQFAQKNGLDFPLLADVGGRVAKEYGVKRSLDLLKVKRTTFVINTHARIVDVIDSQINLNIHAERALEALRAMAA
jgi:peroxiredoxin Q/BCP